MSTAENMRGLDRLDLDSGGMAPDDRPGATRSGETFWDRKTTLADLIARQGAKPVTRIEDLKADFWPEEESIDEFVRTIRQWRCEGE